MSLMPIQNEKSALELCHGVDAGLFATVLRNWLTWSVSESTVGSNGATSDASIVAPPNA